MFELEDETPDSKKLVVDRLVTRNEEFPENIITSVADFRKYVLPNIEVEISLYHTLWSNKEIFCGTILFLILPNYFV